MSLDLGEANAQTGVVPVFTVNNVQYVTHMFYPFFVNRDAFNTTSESYVGVVLSPVHIMLRCRGDRVKIQRASVELKPLAFRGGVPITTPTGQNSKQITTTASSCRTISIYS